MNKTYVTTVAVCVLAVVSVGVGVIGFATARKISVDTMRALQPLEQRVRMLEMQMAKAAPRRSNPDMHARRTPLSGNDSAEGGPIMGLTSNDFANGKVNPEVLSRMSDHFLRLENITKKQRDLMQRNREQRRADLEKYGQKLLDLYAAARPGGNGQTDEASQKASDEAFASLVSQYPTANSTGMAIAERALNAALDLNSDEVIQYYNMLKSSDAYAHVVTDNGMEAIPTLQSYLVQDYLSRGQIAEARALITDMRNNYADSVILDRSPDSPEPVWRSGAEVANNLEQLINSGGGTQPPPPRPGQ